MPQRIVGSYSFFNELDNCPRKAFETRIARTIQFVETQPQRWGNYVHTAMEQRIGDGKVIDDELLKPLEPYALAFDRFKQAGHVVQTEAKLSITSSAQPTKWWGPECYVAGKVDVVLHFHAEHLDITDWKTGKDTYETPFELELHALLLAATIAPVRARFTARYVYVGRDGVPDKVGQTYDVSDVGATWAKVNSLMSRAYDYAAKGHWPEQPNPLCGWCAVHQCRHNKVKQREAREAAK